MSFRLDGVLGPMIDFRSGALDYTARATGTLRATLPARSQLSLALGVLQSFGDIEERPTSTGYTSAMAEVPLGKFVDLDATAAYYLQKQIGIDATSSVAIFLGVTVHTLPLRFEL